MYGQLGDRSALSGYSDLLVPSIRAGRFMADSGSAAGGGDPHLGQVGRRLAAAAWPIAATTPPSWREEDDAERAGRHDCGATMSGRSAGRTKSAIAALNLPGSSTNGSWPERSNHTSFFTGAVKASK